MKVQNNIVAEKNVIKRGTENSFINYLIKSESYDSVSNVESESEIQESLDSNSSNNLVVDKNNER